MAMSESDVFIFINTHQSSSSEWIQKELRYAILRNMPVLWVRMDNADVSKLKVEPTEKPHLCYSSKDSVDDSNLVNITDQLLEMAFKLVLSRNNKVLDSLENIKKIFGSTLVCSDLINMVYSVSVPRRGIIIHREILFKIAMIQ